jgi:predicted negative regulator of RcsB-dependent stress response
MPLDLEEQEQIDQLKAFWQKYRNLITTVVTVALFSYAGYSGYQWWRNSQAVAASQLFATMVSALEKNDQAQAFRAADDLQKDYGRTTYAAISSLVASKVASDGANSEKALTYLRWAAANASDDAYLAVAKLRLAGQLIEQGAEKDFAEADAILKTKPIIGFEGLWLERRGDWYLAQKKVTDARSSYEAAWKLLQKSPEFPVEARQLLKVKIDAVGGVAQ